MGRESILQRVQFKFNEDVEIRKFRRMRNKHRSSEQNFSNGVKLSRLRGVRDIAIYLSTIDDRRRRWS
mgnify:CR=1 FL=1